MAEGALVAINHDALVIALVRHLHAVAGLRPARRDGLEEAAVVALALVRVSGRRLEQRQRWGERAGAHQERD